MNSVAEKWGLVLGRLLLSVIFVLSGFGKMTQFANTATMMAGAGIPLAKAALVLTIVIELGGGLLLISGYQVRYVALIMALFLVPVTLVFHKFWGIPAQEQQMQMVNFLKNVAIMGGLVVAAVSDRAARPSGK
ncbi:MAG TPA: DoxX family protein [Verrucomicrobiae bacterium]|jgi:putative oxidoreductase|nr:DoxX family protein [Verrucomicrobiae bacterium]